MLSIILYLLMLYFVKKNMKKFILILLILVSKLSFASFPVVEKVSNQTTGSMTDPFWFSVSFYILGLVAGVLWYLTFFNFLKNGFRRRQWWLYLSSSILLIYFAFWFVAPLLWMALYFLIVEPNF